MLSFEVAWSSREQRKSGSCKNVFPQL